MGVNRLNPVQKATYLKKNEKWGEMKTDLPTTEKKTVIKIITKTKLLGQ